MDMNATGTRTEAKMKMNTKHEFRKTHCFHMGCGCTSPFDGDSGREWVVIYATGPLGAGNRPKYGKALPVCGYHAHHHRENGGPSCRVTRNPRTIQAAVSL